MPFPVRPEHNDTEDQFLIQDPSGIRHEIIPLVELHALPDRVIGLGTAFRIDPFGTFLSAQHVLDHRFVRPPTDSSAVAGLLNPGLVYGSAALDSDHFARISRIETYRSFREDPLAILRGRAETINSFDCIRLDLDQNNARLRERSRCLPLDFRAPVKVGDRLLAIGFPGLPKPVDNPTVVISEKMYGAVGVVSELYPQGRDRTCPWPTIAVRANWRGGMSGGPVFNEQGNVIGMVSKSIDPDLTNEGAGYAFWLRQSDIMQAFLPTVDLVNPGSSRVWGVLRKMGAWHLDSVHQSKESAQLRLTKVGDSYEIRFGSYQHETDNFVS